jgi:transcriptional regulator with XRE-family HTH domain
MPVMTNHSSATETLGRFLYRRRLGLTPPPSQGEIARRAGVSSSTISRLEGDHTPNPPLETLARVAPYYAISVLDLWQRAGYLTTADVAGFVALLAEVSPLALINIGLERSGLDRVACDLIEHMIRGALARHVDP